MGEGDQRAVDGIELGIDRGVIKGKATGNDCTPIHSGRELKRDSQCILPAFGPSHDSKSFDVEVFE